MLPKRQVPTAFRRGTRPFVFTNLKDNKGVAEIADFVLRQGGIAA